MSDIMTPIEQPDYTPVCKEILAMCTIDMLTSDSFGSLAVRAVKVRRFWVQNLL